VTAHDTALANDADRRSGRYDPDDYLLDDVADLLLMHRRNGTECTCENRPDGGSWLSEQVTHEEHVTVELAKAGYLRDAGVIADLLNQIARQAGQIEQLTQANAISHGHRHPFHPQEQP
jgi:hypothetical protein